MSNIIAMIRFDDGRLYHDPDDLKKLAQAHESAARIIHSKISQAGGKIVATIKGDIVAELPFEKAEALRDIVDLIQNQLNLICRIGVGEDTREASLALKKATEDKKAIKVYTPEIRSGEQTVAVSEEDQMQKSEDSGLSLEKEDKAKIAQILSLIAQHKDQIESLKESSPEAYAGVHAVIGSLAEIIEASKKHQAKESDRVISEINKSLDSHKKQYISQKEKAILKVLSENREAHDGGNHSSDVAVVAKSNDDRSSTSSSIEEGASLQKAKLSPSISEKAIEAIKKIHLNKDKFKELQEQNPEAIMAIGQLTKILGQMLSQHTGEDTDSRVAQAQIEHHLETERPHPVRVHEDERVTHPRPTYAPGSIRQYAPGKARQKTDDGSWKTYSGKPKLGD
jgi:mitochondrial fission protein ELM1